MTLKSITVIFIFKTGLLNNIWRRIYGKYGTKKKWMNKNHDKS
jgi:hypothetical protein